MDHITLPEWKNFIMSDFPPFHTPYMQQIEAPVLINLLSKYIVSSSGAQGGFCFIFWSL